MDMERLARVETKIDAMSEKIDAFTRSQKEHNEIFYKNRDKVERMEAKHGAISALAVFISGVISVVAGFFSHK